LSLLPSSTPEATGTWLAQSFGLSRPSFARRAMPFSPFLSGLVFRSLIGE
jgi:hypothetical protein